MGLKGYIRVLKRTGENGSRFPVVGECVFGTSLNCDVRLHVKEVASEHCVVCVEDNGQAIIQNLTEYPTLLNGTALKVGQRKPLAHEDMITVSERKFRWEYLPTSQFYVQSSLEMASLRNIGMTNRMITVPFSSMHHTPHSSNRIAVVTPVRREDLRIESKTERLKKSSIPVNKFYRRSSQGAQSLLKKKSSTRRSCMPRLMTVNTAIEKGLCLDASPPVKSILERTDRKQSPRKSVTGSKIKSRKSVLSDTSISAKKSSEKKSPRQTPSRKSIHGKLKPIDTMGESPVVQNDEKSLQRSIKKNSRMSKKSTTPVSSPVPSKTPRKSIKPTKGTPKDEQNITKITEFKSRLKTPVKRFLETPESVHQTSKRLKLTPNPTGKKNPLSNHKKSGSKPVRKPLFSEMVKSGAVQKRTIVIQNAMKPAQMKVRTKLHLPTAKSTPAAMKWNSTGHAESPETIVIRKKLNTPRSVSKRKETMKKSRVSATPAKRARLSVGIKTPVRKGNESAVNSPLLQKSKSNSLNEMRTPPSGKSKGRRTPQSKKISPNDKTTPQQVKMGVSTGRLKEYRLSRSRKSSIQEIVSIDNQTPLKKSRASTVKEAPLKEIHVSKEKKTPRKESRTSFEKLNTKREGKSSARKQTPLKQRQNICGEETPLTESKTKGKHTPLKGGKAFGRETLLKDKRGSTGILSAINENKSFPIKHLFVKEIKVITGKLSPAQKNKVSPKTRKDTRVTIVNLSPAKKSKETPRKHTPLKETRVSIRKQSPMKENRVSTGKRSPAQKSKGSTKKFTLKEIRVSIGKLSPPKISKGSPRKHTPVKVTGSPRRPTPVEVTGSPRRPTPVKVTGSPRRPTPVKVTGSPRPTPVKVTGSPRRPTPVKVTGSPRRPTPVKVTGSPRRPTPVKLTGSPRRPTPVKVTGSPRRTTPVKVTEFPRKHTHVKDTKVSTTKLTPGKDTDVSTEELVSFKTSVGSSRKPSPVKENRTSLRVQSPLGIARVNSRVSTGKLTSQREQQTSSVKHTPTQSRTSVGKPTPKESRSSVGKQTPKESRSSVGKRTPKESGSPVGKAIPKASGSPVGKATPKPSGSPVGKATPKASGSSVGKHTRRENQSSVGKQTPKEMKSPRKETPVKLSTILTPVIQKGSSVRRSVKRHSPDSDDEVYSASRNKILRKSAVYSSPDVFSQRNSSFDLSSVRTPQVPQETFVSPLSSHKSLSDAKFVKSSNRSNSRIMNLHMGSRKSSTPVSGTPRKSVRNILNVSGIALEGLAGITLLQKPVFETYTVSSLSPVKSPLPKISSGQKTPKSLTKAKHIKLVTTPGRQTSGTPKGKRSLKNDLANVKKLLRTPKSQVSPKNDLRDVRGVKKLLATPKVQASPKNDLRDVRGVKKLLSTPKVQASPKNDLRDVRGVKKLLSTPKVQASPKNDLRDVRGVKKLLASPKVQASPKNDLRDVRGVKKLLATPKVQASPKNDLRDVRGVKKLLATPKVQASPKNDLRDVRGVKRLLGTPKVQVSPKNDLRDVRGIKNLLRSPRYQTSPRNDLTDVTGIQELFVVHADMRENKELHVVQAEIESVSSAKRSRRKVVDTLVVERSTRSRRKIDSPAVESPASSLRGRKRAEVPKSPLHDLSIESPKKRRTVKTKGNLIIEENETVVSQDVVQCSESKIEEKVLPIKKLSKTTSKTAKGRKQIVKNSVTIDSKSDESQNVSPVKTRRTRNNQSSVDSPSVSKRAETIAVVSPLPITIETTAKLQASPVNKKSPVASRRTRAKPSTSTDQVKQTEPVVDAVSQSPLKISKIAKVDKSPLPSITPPKTRRARMKSSAVELPLELVSQQNRSAANSQFSENSAISSPKNVLTVSPALKVKRGRANQNKQNTHQDSETNTTVPEVKSALSTPQKRQTRAKKTEPKSVKFTDAVPVSEASPTIRATRSKRGKENIEEDLGKQTVKESKKDTAMTRATRGRGVANQNTDAEDATNVPQRTTRRRKP